MKHLRSSFGLKLVAVLLVVACGCATALFGLLGAMELVCYDLNDWERLVASYYNGDDSYQNQAMSAFLLQEGEEQLTYLGKQRYEELCQQLDADQTNFRYRILDMEGNTLMTNVESDATWESEVDTSNITRRVYTVYDLSTFRVVQDTFKDDPTYFDLSSNGVNFFGNYDKFYDLFYSMLALPSEFVGSYLGPEHTSLTLGTLYSYTQGVKNADFWRCYFILCDLFVFYQYGGFSEYDWKVQLMSEEAWADSSLMWTEVDELFAAMNRLAYEDFDFDLNLTEQSDLTGEAKAFAEDQNLPDTQTVFTGTTSANITWFVPISQGFVTQMQQAVNQLEDTECFILEWGVDRQMEVGDGLYTAYLRSQSWEESFKGDCILAALCGFVALLALVWLLYAAGHVAGYEGIHLNTFERFPQDLMLAAVVFGMMVLLSLAGFFWDDIHLYDVIGQSTLDRYLMCAAGALQVAVAILLCLPLVTCSAVQLKDHSFWRRTLLGHLTRWMGALLRLLPAAWRAVGGYLLLTLIVVGGAFLLLTWGLVGDWVLVLLLILWITGLGLVIRWSGGWQRLRESGQALAEGDLTWQTDLRGLPREMQRHGENLNAVSHTIEQAVEQQMKSDRFRTELITNVSHDLKTPLTSIINYVDLLKKLDLPEPEARAYLEVLDRKSQRLKTLTEDLVEASKASAGVLPVNKTRLEVGELLRQAVGEYEDKLHAAQLEARISTPAEPVWIMADGRHTWRILDNLLSNCSKYAMPGTRVYVEAQKEEGTVAISVKNISADPLNVPAEELLERFVRGDSSRTTEGSGLGLSIAQSLATLQGATLTLEVDGDLFKATLRFPEAGEEAPSPDSTADEILS